MTRRVGIAFLVTGAIAGLVLAGAAMAESEEKSPGLLGPDLLVSMGLEVESGLGGVNPCAGAPMIEHPLPDSAPGEYVCLPQGTSVSEAGVLMIRFSGREPSALELEFLSLQEELAALQEGAELEDPMAQARQAEVVDRIVELRELCADLEAPTMFCDG